MPTPPEAITGTLHRVADRARQLEVEADLGAVAVHAGEQDLAGAALGHAPRPVHRVEAGVLAPAVGVDVPARRRPARAWRRSRRRCTARRTCREASRITSGSATAAELKLTLSAPALSSRRTSSTVRTPPPTVSGMKTCDGHRLDHVQDQVAPVAGGGDVEEGELVGALLVVARGDLHRVAGVAQLDEVDALDDAARR